MTLYRTLKSHQADVDMNILAIYCFIQISKSSQGKKK